MKFGKFVGQLVALAALSVGAAHAQLGVYGLYQGTDLSGIQCLNTGVAAAVGSTSATYTAAPCANGTRGEIVNGAGAVVAPAATGSQDFTGGFGGVFYDWKTYGPVRLGFDVRAGEKHSNKSASSSAGGANATSSQDFLGGVRGSFHTPIKVLKPYAQFSMGWGRSNVTEPFGNSTASSSTPIPPRTYDHFLEYEGFIGLDVKIFSIKDLRSSVGIKSVGFGLVFHMPQ
jgi:hypothetical protein